MIRQRSANRRQASLQKKKAGSAHRLRVNPFCIDWIGTLVRKAGKEGSLTWPWQHQDLVFRKRAQRTEKLVCLVLDCSASMLQQHNLALAKRLLLHWVERLYHQRHQLTVLGFNGQQVQLLQPVRKAAAFNEDWISAIAGGGGTPVTLGLTRADDLLLQARRKHPGLDTELWLLTDGRFHQLPSKPLHADQCTVIDFEQHMVALGRAKQIAQLWQSDYLVATDFYDTHSPSQSAIT